MGSFIFHYFEGKRKKMTRKQPPLKFTVFWDITPVVVNGYFNNAAFQPQISRLSVVFSHNDR
jgi:hypothetical protein